MERQDGGGAPEGRAMGEQPLARMMRERGLANHDLVAASARPITHKLVMRAARGRRLTLHSKALVVEAFNRATGGPLRLLRAPGARRAPGASKNWRRGRDSNPRYLAAHLISSQAPSTTQTSLRGSGAESSRSVRGIQPKISV